MEKLIEIHKKYLEGMNIYELAEQYNTSHTTLYRWFKKNNLKVFNKSESKKENRNPAWKGGNSDSYLHHIARKTWEKANGKIPQDFIIHHIDGNPENNNIENLKMLHYTEHNRLHIKQGDYF